MKSRKMFFVHGIGNEGRSAASINSSWFDSLKSAWTRDGYPVDTVRFETSAAYYGDKLADLTRNWLNNEFSIIDQSVEQDAAAIPDLVTLYQEYEEALRDSGRVARTIGPEGEVVITEMGFPHHRSVKAIGRTIEALSPEDGNFLAKKFLPQAAVYIRRPGAAMTIDDIVKEQLLQHLGDDSEMVVISHSLGSVSSYRILRKLASPARFPLSMTLGSPLASEAIRKVLPVPRVRPANVDLWLNAADERDFVALHPELTKETFGPAEIRNLKDISNADENRHSIVGYLRHPTISKAIWDALNL